MSSAIKHVLLGGSPQTATITIDDMAEIDIRETIGRLVGAILIEVSVFDYLKLTYLFCLLQFKKNQISRLTLFFLGFCGGVVLLSQNY